MWLHLADHRLENEPFYQNFCIILKRFPFGFGVVIMVVLTLLKPKRELEQPFKKFLWAWILKNLFFRGHRNFWHPRKSEVNKFIDENIKTFETGPSA